MLFTLIEIVISSSSIKNEALSQKIIPKVQKCGTNLTYTLRNGILTIEGSGKMDNYFYQYETPWYYSRTSITTIILSEGLETIGSYSFSNSTQLTTIEIPNTVTRIGYESSLNCIMNQLILKSLALKLNINMSSYKRLYN